MSQALCFNDVQFDIIKQNQAPWVRGIQIGYALGYPNPRQSIAKLYDSHADEFTDAMTAVITLPTEGGPQETRIFSLRGCHLLAMFARTPVAKQFRRWVLDVIEQYGDRVPVADPVTVNDTSPLSKRTDPERKALTAIINTWVGMAPIHYAGARAQVNAHFGVTGVDKLTVAQVKEAIAWVQSRIDALSPAREQLALLPAPKPYREQCAEVVAEMHALHGEFFKVSEKMMNTFAKPFYATALSPIPEHMKPFAHAMNLAINNFWMAMFKDFATLEDLYRAYVEAEKVLNG